MRRAADIGAAEAEGRLLTKQSDGFELSVATPTAPLSDPRELRRRTKAQKRAQRRMSKGGVERYDKHANAEKSASKKENRKNPSIMSSGITTPRPGHNEKSSPTEGYVSQGKHSGKTKRRKKKGKARHLPIPPLPIPESATPHLSVGWSKDIHGAFHGPHGPGLQAFGMLHSHCEIGGANQNVGIARSSVHPWGGQTEA